MTNRDFAATHNRDADVPSSFNSTRVVIIVGMMLLVISSFAGGFWLGKETEKQLSSSTKKDNLLKQILQQQQKINELEIVQAKAEEERVALQKEGEKVDDISTDVGPLTFYNELPKQSVTPEPLSTPNEQVPNQHNPEDILQQELSATPQHIPTLLPVKPENSREVFRLQVGSFQKREEADGLKQKLAKLEIAAAVHQTEIDGRGIWYRVLLGPYLSRNEAELIRKDIQQSMHITGLIVGVSE